MGDSGVSEEEIKCRGQGSAVPARFPGASPNCLDLSSRETHPKEDVPVRLGVKFRLISFLHLGTLLNMPLKSNN